MPDAAADARLSPALYYRHRLPVRIMHWTNVVCFIILFMSGMGIFNAHPGLYWGDSSYTGRPPILSISAENQRGIVRVAGHEFDTTGLLGISERADGSLNQNAFPSWMTIPGDYSLAHSRLWHFFFAWLFVINGMTYVLYAILSRHLKKNLLPDRSDLRGIGASINEHLHFRHPHGEAAKNYNVLQKLVYLVVIFILLPLIILMGMAMSPMLDSVMTGWVDWFGGRQSARTIHFIVAWLLVGFTLIHVFEVIISGVWNNLRSMLTGYYAIRSATDKGKPR